MIERPYWIAAGTMGWGGIILWKAAELPQFDQYAHIGPGFTPSLIGMGLILLGLILVLQIHRGVRFEEQGAEDINESHQPSHRALVIAIAACAFPILAMTTLGFIITCTGSFFLITLAFKSRRWILNIAIGLAVSLVSWWLFRRLGVQLGDIIPFLGV